jgi:hypothetical protein
MITENISSRGKFPYNANRDLIQERTHLSVLFSKSEEESMCQLYPDINRRDVGSLQFELESTCENVYQDIFALRKKAEQLFSKTSRIFRLFDEDCFPSSSRDVLLEPKLMSQCILLRDKKIKTIWPTTTIGFAFLLPTNKVGYIGFSTYEDKDKYFWNGLVDTFDMSSKLKDCIESHKLVCDFLLTAEFFGILREVKDSTGYWETKNPESFATFNHNPNLEV